MSRSTHRLLKTHLGVTHFARVTVSTGRVPPSSPESLEWTNAAQAGLQAAQEKFGLSREKYAVESIHRLLVDTTSNAISLADFMAVATAEGRLDDYAAERGDGTWT